MARKYFGSFYSITNNQYRVELWDSASGTTPEITARLYAERVLAAGGYQEGSSCLLTKLQSLNSSTELILASDGFNLEIQGQGTPWYESPIRSSKVSTQWVIPDQTVLDDFISLSTNLENYWALIVYRDNAPFFIGRVVADQMTRLRESIASKPIIDLTAVDGLELMEGFKVDESWFTDGKIQPTYLIRKCLEKLNLYNYWVTLGISNSYFYDASVIYATNAVRKGLDVMYLDINTFLPDYDPFQDVKSIDVINGIYEPLNMIDCRKAIEMLAINFGCRFMHDKGSYWFYAANGYAGSTIAYRRYSYTMGYQGASTYSHRQTIGSHARPEWMAKPSLTYQPAIQKLVINQKRQMGAKKVRSYDDKATPAFELISTQIPTGSTPDSAPMRIRVISKSEIYRASGTKKEDRTFMNVMIWVENSSGAKMQANGSGYWSSVGVATGELVEKITLDMKGTWVDMVWEKSLTTAPIGYDKLYIKIDYVKAAEITYTKLTGWKSSALVNKEFWGAIQVAFADSSAYQNPDLVYDLAEQFFPSSSSSVNSSNVEIDVSYYTAPNKFSVGNILVSDGTNTILETDWHAGYDSITTGTLTKMLGNTLSGLYANFVPIIQGNWIDSGSYSPIKSLYFDNYTWLLNGVQYSGRSEQWNGEWLAVSPVYADLTTTGEGLRIGKSPTQVIGDRINAQEQTITSLSSYIQNVPNQVLEHLVNYADQAPTTQPTQDTQWVVKLKYTDSTELVTWKLIEEGTVTTYTAGVHSLLTNYQLHTLNCATGNITINLPSATLWKGEKYCFVKLGSAHNATINALGGQTINGADHFNLNTNYQSHTIQSDGIEWFIIAAHP